MYKTACPVEKSNTRNAAIYYIWKSQRRRAGVNSSTSAISQVHHSHILIHTICSNRQSHRDEIEYTLNRSHREEHPTASRIKNQLCFQLVKMNASLTATQNLTTLPTCFSHIYIPKDSLLVPCTQNIFE